MSFVHLHTHSHYSLLDGLSRPDDLIARAKKLKMPAIALTDHGALYGAIEFYQKCQAAGIKPIIGVEAYIAVRSRFDKEPNIDNRRYHLTLLAYNNIGYQNLLKLVSASYLEGYYYKPRMDKELLRAHREGLICLSGCLGSELGQTLYHRDLARAREVIAEYQDIFGKENYYLEIMHHPGLERQLEVKAATISLAKELTIPLVGTQDSHYLEPTDRKAHATLVAIQTATDLENNKVANQNEDFSFIDPQTAKRYFADAPEAVTNTLEIAERCQLELALGKFIFPDFKLESGETGDSQLRKIALAGLAKKGLDRSEAARQRLDHELEIIRLKGYASYFLVVEDLIRFARERGIYYNIRGSVAGSITTYLLDITKVDPLVYKIPFERFLNPDRPSAPDIDMDFADDRRDEIIDYTRGKYGEDKVAQIGTFGSMMARGAVRDVARALGKPYSVGDRLSRLIPMGKQGFPMTIDRAMKLMPELKAAYDSEADTKEIVDLAKKIEGSVRHISVHAAGVVIAPGALTDYTPLQFDPKGGKIITQFDMYDVGEDGVGLTKFDFLGLRNLTILEGAVKLLAKIHGERIDLEKIPLDDKKTFAMLSRGETIGLFQLNGAGLTKWLKELKPTSIHDINAMVALYRPGPMQFIPEYIARKHNPKLIKYPDQSVKPILEQTYGVLVYQDDLLMMAHNLAGYTWGEVDKFRKAVGKKIPELMAEQREKFIKGCIDHSGWKREKATEIWTWLEPFAAYGFNKAHSVSYGRVAYQTAYMKANFPTEYMTAVLTAESGNVEEIGLVINECKRMGILVLPPDLNESFEKFTALIPGKGAAVEIPLSEPNKIRFGLYTIKNLGSDIAEAIVSERKRGGNYKSVADFLSRVTHKNLNKKSLEALIKSGALDSLGEDRGSLLANLDLLLEYHRESIKAAGQDSLFGDLAETATTDLKLIVTPAASLKEKLAWEKELLGLYLSGHPLEDFREKIAKAENTITTVKNKRDGSQAVVAGVIEEVKVILTKKGDQMAFVRIADFDDKIETVVFADLFAGSKEHFQAGKCLAFKGRVSFRNGETSIVVEAVKELSRD